MAAGIKACRSSFGTCRKYEDDISSAIFACNVNPKALLSKLKSLDTNIKKLAALEAVLKNLSSRKARYTRAITSCTQIGTETDKVVKKAKSNPADTTIAGSISAIETAASTVTCTPAEKTALKAKAESVTAAKAASQESYDSTAADVQGKYVCL